MSLREDIEEQKKLLTQKPKKKREILESYRAEICEMIALKIPIKTQIELIKKNLILEKLEYREYYLILKNYFGLVTKSSTKLRTETKIAEQKKPGTSQEQRKQFDAVKELSKDFDLLSLAPQ